jgi:RecB family endonuclease NucS
MEFIRVTFDPADIRDVIANGDVIGPTETLLIVQPDFYVISLSGSGYAPSQWRGPVSGSLPDQPLTIRFTRD